MATRTDLLLVAESLAAAARENATGGDNGSAGELIAAAKTALEAAALAESVPVGVVDQALGQIQGLLEEAGVLQESLELEPVEFLNRAFRALLAWRREALEAQGYQFAYARLRKLATGLERDFIAGDTDTSRRIAARIHTALEDADEVLEKGASLAEEHA